MSPNLGDTPVSALRTLVPIDGLTAVDLSISTGGAGSINDVRVSTSNLATRPPPIGIASVGKVGSGVDVPNTRPLGVGAVIGAVEMSPAPTSVVVGVNPS